MQFECIGKPKYIIIALPSNIYLLMKNSSKQDHICILLIKMNPISKIQNFINILNKRFKFNYYPQKELIIDESMQRGRCSLKVHRPLKPTKCGFKDYVLCHSTSRYVLSWTLFDGKKRNLVEITEQLTSHYDNKGYHISFDRFYTTRDTIKYLTERGCTVIGGVMKNSFQLNEELKNELENLELYKFTVLYIKLQIIHVYTTERQKDCYLIIKLQKQLDQ
ncbi:hypothetical protein ABPG72_020534 [Tetrahymena utriculariae]